MRIPGAIPDATPRSGTLAPVSNITRGILPFPVPPGALYDWLPRQRA
jgi:hypothetical protein